MWKQRSANCRLPGSVLYVHDNGHCERHPLVRLRDRQSCRAGCDHLSCPPLDFYGSYSNPSITSMNKFSWPAWFCVCSSRRRNSVMCCAASEERRKQSWLVVSSETRHREIDHSWLEVTAVTPIKTEESVDKSSASTATSNFDTNKPKEVHLWHLFNCARNFQSDLNPLKNTELTVFALRRDRHEQVDSRHAQQKIIHQVWGQ